MTTKRVISKSQETSAAGIFEFSGLGVGEVSVRARGPHAALWSRLVVITDGGALELLIELSEGGMLVGQVPTAHGDPAPGARIAAFPNEDPGVPQAGTRTDEEGRFRLPHVSAGTRGREIQSVVPLVRGDSRELGRVTSGVR